MIDLCSGLGGASVAMRDRGWQVVTVDIDPIFEPDIVADVREWTWNGDRPDLIWASPPCVEFARESMPWSRTGQEPDISIVLACKRIIDEAIPRYWIIENVRGAQPYFKPYLGSAASVCNPYYLWGFFPSIGEVRINGRTKESYSSQQRAERAMIPYSLSLVVALAVENQPELLPASTAAPQGT